MQIITGEAMETLRLLPSSCCSTCVTSPPYYGLRNYGAAGQIGLEETPDEYVEKLVEIFREVRRVLKDDGTLVEATQTARENVIGNGWTADVITYIFSGLKEGREENLEKINKPERSNTMRKRFIYICSPCKGDMERNITKAQGYCREAAELFPDVVPIAPHVYCTQFLDDTNPKERALGMDLGISLLSMCSELWAYGMDNPSEGMKAEIEYAKEHGILVRDAVEVYQHTGEELPDAELGDALIVLPSHVGSLNGIAAIESTTVRISGEAVVELAHELRKHPGHDITMEAEA